MDVYSLTLLLNLMGQLIHHTFYCDIMYLETLLYSYSAVGTIILFTLLTTYLKYGKLLIEPTLRGKALNCTALRIYLICRGVQKTNTGY